jgi:hypothetical protein
MGAGTGMPFRAAILHRVSHLSHVPGDPFACSKPHIARDCLSQSMRRARFIPLWRLDA